MSEITIDESKRKRILSLVGYPFITLEDLTGDNSLTMDDIEDMLIWPALQEYFQNFPIKNSQTYSVGTSFEIPYPNDNTYGVFGYKFLYEASVGATRTDSPFANAVLYQKSSGMSSGKYGTAYNYDLSSAEVLERSLRNVQVQSIKSTKLNIDRRLRKAYGYTNTRSRIEIIWAEYSKVWNDIPFEDETDVIKLAQANVLEFFGQIRNQASTNIPTELDGSDFISKAEDLRQEVRDKWQNSMAGSILR